MAGRPQRARAGPRRRRRRRRSARLLGAPARPARRRAAARARGAERVAHGLRACRSPWPSRPREGEVVAALPISPELRADPGAVGERAGALAAAAVEHVVEGASPGPPRSREDLALVLGELDGMLALAYPAADPAEAAEYAHEALAAEFEERRIDRLRARAHLLPGHVLEAVGGPARADRRDAPAARGRGGDAAGRLAARRGDAWRRSSSSCSSLLEPSGSVAARARGPRPGAPRGAPHPPAARRHGEVGRLPHGLRPPGARLRRPRARAGLRGGRGAPGGGPARAEAERGPAPRLPEPAAKRRHPPPDRRRRAAARARAAAYSRADAQAAVRVHAQRAAALDQLAAARRPPARGASRGPRGRGRRSSPRRTEPHERRQLGLGGDQLHRHARLHRAVAHERLRERDERGVGGVAGRRLGRRAGGAARCGRARSPRAARRRAGGASAAGRPRICSRPCLSRGVRRASSTSAWSGSTEPGGRSAPRASSSRHSASSRATAAGGVAEPAEAGQPLVGALRVALVARRPRARATPRAPTRAGRARRGAARARRRARAAGARRPPRTRAAAASAGRLSQRVKPSLPFSFTFSTLRTSDS